MIEKDYLISASILSADYTTLGDQLNQAKAAGADWFHIDIMDGHFVPNLAMGPTMVAACRRATDLPLDVHLMIEKPERHLEKFASAGASNLTVHIETCPDMKKTQQIIKDLGCKVGITLKPETSAEEIKPFLNDVDIVLVMSVNPGYSGQAFMPEMLPKISQLRRWLDEVNPDAKIQIDGGVNTETIESCYQAGARVIVAATAIFKHPQGIAAGIKSLTDQL